MEPLQSLEIILTAMALNIRRGYLIHHSEEICRVQEDYRWSDKCLMWLPHHTVCDFAFRGFGSRDVSVLFLSS